MIFAFYILVLCGIQYAENLNYHQKFEQNTWLKSELKPFKMAKTLTKENVLIGQTKQQIISKLGLPKEHLKNENVDYIIYNTYKDSWQLKIYFKNDQANDVFIYKVGLNL